MSRSSRRWIDLGQPWGNAMAVGRVHGRPELSNETVWRDDSDANCQVTVTRMSASVHTGTHVDAPRHLFADGPTIDTYGLGDFVGDGVALELLRPGGGAVSAEDLEAAVPSIERGDIVFLRLGFGERFADDAYRDHPHLTKDAARLLVDRGVRMLGVDTLSPDLAEPRREPDFDFPVHRCLLEAGVLIVENLGPGLADVAATRTTLGAIPLRLVDSEGGPAVAFALAVDEEAMYDL